MLIQLALYIYLGKLNNVDVYYEIVNILSPPLFMGIRKILIKIRIENVYFGINSATKYILVVNYYKL